MQAQAQHVHRRLQQLGGAAGDQQRHDRVVRDHRPVPVDGERRPRLVRLQHQLDRGAAGGQRRVVEAALGEHRREAGGGEPAVALAQRHVEPIGEAQHHLAARLGAAGLEIAEVAGRDLGLAGEVELAEAAAQAPVAQQRADRRRGGGGSGVHRVTIAKPAPPLHDLRGHRRRDAARRRCRPCLRRSAAMGVAAAGTMETSTCAPPSFPLPSCVASGGPTPPSAPSSAPSWPAAAGPLGELIGLPARAARRRRAVAAAVRRLPRLAGDARRRAARRRLGAGAAQRRLGDRLHRARRRCRPTRRRC